MKDEGADRTPGDEFDALSRNGAPAGDAPVDSWDPPYCGDIGLAIGADGAWSYRGSPIAREGLVKLFARVLRRDENGRHYLVTPVEKVDVTVADAPFRAVEMQVRGAGAAQSLVFRTNVDDIVTAGPRHALNFTTDRTSGGLKPYLRVRGRLDALLTRAVTIELVALAVPDDNGVLGVWSGGTWFEIGRHP